MSEELLLGSGIPSELLDIIKEMISVERLELNPMQLDFVKGGFLEKDRLIILSPAASGKTLLVFLKYAKEVEKGNKKMIYLLPFVRIRTELLRKLKKLEKVAIVATDDYLAYESGKADILVATYASMDAWLLRGRKPAANFFVFDEVDMITDDLQGTKVESSVSRLIRESSVEKVHVLSATIGSPELIEKWLGCETFQSEFRPGQFSKKVMKFSEDKEAHEILEEIFNSEINAKCPMLVFFYNIRRCREYAKRLAEYRTSYAEASSDEKIESAIGEILRKCDKTTEIATEIDCLKQKVGFYHARLQPECKKVVEGLFEEALLDVFFTTPALARGVNLPARTVIVPSPYKFSPYYGMRLLSRAELEQIFGRACRPPFHEIGCGVLYATRSERIAELENLVASGLESISSKFLETSRTKGKILNKGRLAIEVIKEAKMQNRSDEELRKTFDSYLFTQEIGKLEVFYNNLDEIIRKLMEAGLLERNIVGEIITPTVVDLIIDSGIDELRRMICLKNISKAIVENKMDIHTGNVTNQILWELCGVYSSSYGLGVIKEKIAESYKKIKEHILKRIGTEPPEVANEHRLYTALDLYSRGSSLEEIENEYGLEPDSVRYLAVNVVAQDLFLLKKLVEHQSMGEREKVNFCNYLELFASIMKKGVPYEVLPFVELIERLGRRTALNILKRYPSDVELLRVLSDEGRVKDEFRSIDGIGSVLHQRIMDRRQNLIENLQRKITLWGTFNF